MVTTRANAQRNSTRVELSLGHRYLKTKKANVPGTRSVILEFEPPQLTTLRLERNIRPFIKLKGGSGYDIPGDSEIFFAKKIPARQTPRFLDGYIPYYDFEALDTKEQRKGENSATLTKDLGAGIIVRQGELIQVYLESDVAVDLDQPGSTFQFVTWGAPE